MYISAGVPPTPPTGTGGMAARWLIALFHPQALKLLVAIPIILGVTAHQLRAAQPQAPDAVLGGRPGGPDRRSPRRARPEADPELGLDKPVYVRYVRWVEQVAQGNLGYSYADYEPVVRRIAERFGPTAGLVLLAIVLSVVFAVVLGVLSATRPYSAWDYAASGVGLSRFVGRSRFFPGLAATTCSPLSSCASC